MQKERYIGIDVIKVLACMFVPGLHFFVNYGFTEKFLNHPIVIPQIALRWVFFTCIALFILATGYLQCYRKADRGYYRKLINYIMYFFVYAFLTTVFIDGKANFWKNMLRYFLQYPAYFWYMSFFIGFYLLIPFLNIIAQKLERKEYRFFILILLAVTSVPEFVNWMPAFGKEGWKYFFLPNWWREFYPVTYYFIGAYLRKYRPAFNKKLLVCAVTGIPAAIATADYIYMAPGTTSFIGGGYGSILTVLIATAIFALFYDIQIRNKVFCNVISYISNLTLNVYLGLIISDKYTRMIVSRYERNGIYPFRLILLEASVNFGIALGIAVILDFVQKLCIKAVRKIGVACSRP